jgi:hypothetical protein
MASPSGAHFEHVYAPHFAHLSMQGTGELNDMPIFIDRLRCAHSASLARSCFIVTPHTLHFTSLSFFPENNPIADLHMLSLIFM